MWSLGLLGFLGFGFRVLGFGVRILRIKGLGVSAMVRVTGLLGQIMTIRMIVLILQASAVRTWNFEKNLTCRAPKAVSYEACLKRAQKSSEDLPRYHVDHPFSDSVQNHILPPLIVILLASAVTWLKTLISRAWLKGRLPWEPSK